MYRHVSKMGNMAAAMNGDAGQKLMAAFSIGCWPNAAPTMGVYIENLLM
jgi:hypothetical protein